MTVNTKSTPKSALEAFREQKRERSAGQASTEGTKDKGEVPRLAEEIASLSAHGGTVDWLTYRRQIVAELERNAIAKVRRLRERERDAGTK